ncbi:hypothetical protein C8R44DRAFT_596543, partial [Mycena epipterygia]
FLQIWYGLHPMDLLNLARTSRPLRKDLLDRASSCLWKTALAKVDGLPPCPNDLAEPAFVNLAF